MADIRRLLDAEKLQRSLRPHDAVVRTCCALCAAGCGMRIAVRGQTIVDVWGDDQHPLSKGSLCALGSAVIQLPRSSGRILSPRLRERAGEPEREVSWQEALDYAAGRLNAAARQPASIGIAQGKGVSFAGAMSARRLAVAAGFDFLPRRAAAEDAVLDMYLESPPAPEWPQARTLLLLGADPAEREVVTMNWVIDARLRGANVVAVDTRQTETVRKAGSVLAIEPGNVAAVLTALAGAVVEGGFADRECMDTRLEDVDAWLECCRRATLDDAAQRAGIAVERLRTLAGWLVRGFPTLIVLDRDWLGRHFAAVTRAAFGLLCTLGSVAVPSGGLACLGGVDVTSWTNTGDAPVAPAQAAASYAALVVEPGDPARCEEVDTLLQHCANTPTFVIALAALESQATQRADLVLPVALWLESSGVLHRNTSRVLQWYREVVPPAGDARPSDWVWAALGARLGFHDVFPWRSGDDAISTCAMLDTLLSSIPWTSGIGCAALQEDRAAGAIMWPARAGKDGETEQSAFAPWRQRMLRRIRVTQQTAPQADADGRCQRTSASLACGIDLPAGAWPWVERLRQ